MRIVHYYPGALDSSGVTVALWEWALATARAGVDVRVLHGGHHDPPRRPAFGQYEESRTLIDLERVPHSGSHRLLRHPTDLEKRLVKGDVLVLHEGWVTANLVAGRAARRAGIPYIVMPHGVYKPAWRSYLKPPRVIREEVERRLLEHARAVHIFFGSEGVDVQTLAPRSRLMVAPTGFSREVPAWTGGGGYLAWVGRYDPQHKGLDLLVEAVGMLPANERPHVILHGYDYRGGQERLSEQIARQRLGEWIEVKGLIQGEARLDFLRLADGNLHPSRWESHSMALLESLAIGVPTVATSCMDVSAELRCERAAIMVDPTPSSIAEGILQLPERRAELSRNGRHLVASTFSWAKLMPRYLEELERLGLR